MNARARRYVCIDDFRKAARRRLPRIFADFDAYALRQQALRELGPVDLSNTYLGRAPHQREPQFWRCVNGEAASL